MRAPGTTRAEHALRCICGIWPCDGPLREWPWQPRMALTTTPLLYRNLLGENVRDSRTPLGRPEEGLMEPPGDESVAAFRQNILQALSAFPVYFQEVEEIVERVKLQVATLCDNGLNDYWTERGLKKLTEALDGCTAEVWVEGIAVEEGSARVESLRSFSSLVDSLDWAEIAGCENSQHGTRDGTSVLLDSDWEVAWRCPSDLEVLGDATVHHDYCA